MHEMKGGWRRCRILNRLMYRLQLIIKKKLRGIELNVRYLVTIFMETKSNKPDD